MVNRSRQYCYRITHINNLPLLLESGMVCNGHPNASGQYVNIGNPEIIDVRKDRRVRIQGYGRMGEYVPFYFTPRSIMLYNILTGHRHPVVQRRVPAEILVVRCRIATLARLPQWFFTDGQGNDTSSNPYSDLTSIDEIDWDCIQHSNFSKSDGDYDRPRRYQAEFLVRNEVPVRCIDSLNVYNTQAAERVRVELANNNVNLPVKIKPKYFF